MIARLNVGGPAIHVTLLTERLCPPEFTSLLVAGAVPPEEGDMSYYAHEHGVEPIALPWMSREISLKDDLRSLIWLYRFLRRERPDIVHTHTAKAGFVGRTAAWLARVPVIVHTFHGHVLQGYFSPAKTRLFLTLERLCAKMSTRLLTVSQAVKDDLVRYGVAPADKIQVVELGLELDRFARQPRRAGILREELGLTNGQPVVGFCGRLVPIKNPHMLLEAASLVHARQPGVQFAIVGDGEMAGELQARSEALGLNGAVRFLGWRQELPPLVADFDLMALTSNNEGTPVAVIEAAAAGVPAVATRVGGVPDIVTDGETGWLVEPDDSASLAETILGALGDRDELERRGAQARQRALGRFDAARLADDLAALYRSLLALRRPRKA